MPKTFKIEIRTDCKICGGQLPNARYRTYCSAKCRNKANAIKSAPYGVEWQRRKRDRIASLPSDSKCQCLICGKWYVQVGSHIHQIHKISARVYREKFELEVKRGIVPDWYRKLKGDQALDNETYKNLEAGMKYRFKRGDKKAGKYKRSPVTVNRLKNLYKHNKKQIFTSSPLASPTAM